MRPPEILSAGRFALAGLAPFSLFEQLVATRIQFSIVAPESIDFVPLGDAPDPQDEKHREEGRIIVRVSLIW